MFSQGDSITEEKVPQQGSEASSFDSIVIGVMVLLLYGIFGTWFPLWATYNLIFDFSGDSVGFFIGGTLFGLILWRMLYVNLFVSPIIEGLYIENSTIHWVGIPTIGTRVKSIQCTPELEIIRADDNRALFMNSDPQSWYYFMTGKNTFNVNVNRLNNIIQEHV